MPTQASDYPEHLHRIARRYSALMGNLNSQYKISIPEAKENDFRENVFNPITRFVKSAPQLSSILNDPSTLKEIIDFIAKDRDRIEFDVALIHLGCIYAVAATEALERQEQDLAWDFLCEAAYRLGAVVVTNQGEELTTEAVVGIYKSTAASAAASKRHGKTNNLKEHAYSIVRSQAPWLSQAKAVYAVETALKKEFGADCLKNFDDTITGWIKAMPDRLDHIPSLRERLK